MKFFVWNCRGAGNSTFFKNFKNYIDLYKPDCVAIMETKCNSNIANNMFLSLGFREYICQDGVGRSGGIWFAWNPGSIKVHSTQLHQNYIHMSIEYNNKKWWLTTIYASPQPENRHHL